MSSCKARLRSSSECNSQLAQQSPAKRVRMFSTHPSGSCLSSESMSAKVYHTQRHGATLHPCFKPLDGTKLDRKFPRLVKEA